MRFMTSFNQEKNHQLLWIDVSKIIAIICVIVVHAAAPIVLNSEFGSPLWWFGNFLDSASRWAVPLFIMMSGATLLSKNETFHGFYKKRYNRILVPFIFWTFVYFVYDHYVHGTLYTMQIIMQKVIMGNPYVHLYFLYIMIGLYIITPFLRILLNNIDKKHQIYLVTLVSLWSIIQTYFNYRYPVATVAINGFNYFLFYLSYYLLGFVLHNLLVNKHILVFIYLFISLIIVTTSWLVYRDGYTPYIYNYDYLSLNVFLMSIFIFIAFRNTNWSMNFFHPPFITFIASASFGVFLIHPIILDYINNSDIFEPYLVLLKVFCVYVVSLLIVLSIVKIKVIKTIFG